MDALKYAVVGGICTIVDFTIFFTLINVFDIHYLLSSTGSFSVAVILNYYLCIKFLFASGKRFSQAIEILSIFIISILGLFIHQGILFSAVNFIHFNLWLAKTVATIGVFSWNYFGRKYFVFKTRPTIN